MKLGPRLLAKLFFSVSVASFAILPARAEAHLAGISNVASSDAAVAKGMLPNGVAYFLQNVPAEGQSVEAKLVVAVGRDSTAERDLAHLVEHMAFDGTRNYPEGDLIDFLDAKGVQYGANFTGTTGDVTTNYRITFSPSAEMQKDVVKIFYDLAFNMNLSRRSFEVQRGAVIGEFTSFASIPTDFGRLEATLLGDKHHPADILSISEKELESMSLDYVRSFYRSFYTPERINIIIAGPIDVRQLERDIITTFGAAKRSSDIPTVDVFSTIRAHLQDGLKARVFSDPQNPQVQMRIGVARDQIPIPSLPASIRHDQIKKIFVDSLNDRIASVSGLDSGRFFGAKPPIKVDVDMIELAFRPKTVKDARTISRALVSALEQIRRDGLSPDEVRRQKDAIARDASSEPDDLPYPVLVGALSENIGRGWPKWELVNPQQKLRILDSISLDDVNRFAHDHADIVNWGHVIVSGARENNLEAYRSAAVSEIEGLRQRKVETYAPARDGAAKPNDKAPLYSESELDSIRAGIAISDTASKDGVRSYRFGNGVKVIFVPNPSGVVAIRGFRGGGLVAYTDDPAELSTGLTALATALELRGSGGTRILTVASKLGLQYRMLLNERGAKLQIDGNDLQQSLQLLHLLTMRGEKKRSFAGLSAERRQGFDIAKLSPLFDNSSPKQRASISVSRLQDIYSDRFTKIGDFTFVITAADDGRAKSLFEKYIGSLSGERSEILQSTVPTKAIAVRKYDVSYPGNHPGIAHTKMFLSGYETLSKADFFRLQLISDILNIKINDRLRIKEGYVYSPSAEVLIFDNSNRGVRPQSYAFGVAFSTTAKVERRAELAALEAVESLREDPIDQDIFNRAKKNSLARMRGFLVPSNERVFDRIVYEQENGISPLGEEDLAILEGIENDGDFKVKVRRFLSERNLGIVRWLP